MLFVVESARRGFGVAHRTLGPEVRWVLVPWAHLPLCLADPGLAHRGVLCRK
jgi:hypothetical protein